ncbi:MAG TPA: DUF2079 domain-containing protein [Vicinamibacterales bacterium]|nr:DUF2079 domain-containing protein [Vicinamibacterales bacterium]
MYGWRGVANHFGLGTNAYDLSVFDYALWSLTHGGHGTVSFLGHSIFSEHFMPVLYVLAPAHWLSPSPVFLLLIQAVAAATAGVLFRRVLETQQGLSPWLSTALMLVFLLSRRTHSAMAGYFYPEVFQAPLTFAVVLLWQARAWAAWPCMIALLSTKEDAPLYLAGFALFALVTRRGSRRRAIAALTVSVAWFVLALTVAIPASRRADGLSASNPLLEGRYGSPQGDSTIATVGGHLFSRKTAATITSLIATTGLLPLAGAAWMMPALPGVMANLAAAPDSMQSGLIDHYAWPILPWLFLSAAAGASWLHRRWPKAAAAWVVVLLLATAGDNPAIQRMFERRVPPEAAVVRDQLTRVSGTTILAQPNLIPHLPKSASMYAIGSPVDPPITPDLILLSAVGNQWPLTADEVAALVAKYRGDARYEELSTGPLVAFRIKR